MIAFRPARPLKGVGAKGNNDYRHEQSDKRDAVDSEDGHILGVVNGVLSAGKRRISLRLNAQIVVAGRDAGNHDGVILFAFAPGAIAIIAGVVAYLAPEVPGLSGVLIDERVIQINPMVADRGIGFHFHSGSMARKFENISDERSLGFRFGAIVFIGLVKDRLFFRAHIKTGHECEEENSKCGKRDPDAGDIDGDRRRLILVDAYRFGRSAGQLEGVPDFPAIHVLADGPGDFLVQLFAGEDARWMHKVRDGSLFPDTNLPRKFTEDEVRVGLSGLEVFISFSEIICSTTIRGGQRLANADVVPMSVVFAKVANALVRIEQNVLVPIVSDPVNVGATPLEPDEFVVRAAQLAARAERNERFDIVRDGFELLKNREIGIFGVEDRMATRADYRHGLPEGMQSDGGAALGTIQSLRLRLGRPGEWRSARAHHQPSKLRRFFNLRSSNSTNSPRYRAGSGSL